MLDYEEYGSSFRQPRALRDDGGPANNTFQQYDGSNTQPEGRPANPDDEDPTKKPLARTAQPSVGAQVAQAPQTFQQMQAAGIARPPAPPTIMTDPNTFRPTDTGGMGDATWMKNGTMLPGGSGMQPFQYGTPPVLRGDSDPANPSRPGGNMEDTLKGAWEGFTPQTFGGGKDTEMQQKIRDALMSSIGNPSRYDTDTAKRTFDMLSGNIDDDYNARDQGLRESIASRGLGAVGDGTIGTSDQRFQNLQRRSAKADMANTILREQANTYGADRSAALRDAMGYGNDQFGNDLTQAEFNARQKQQAYQNYTGYGQQAFENQTTTADMKARQQKEQYDMLMKMLGIN
jgi:hypothetical protein